MLGLVAANSLPPFQATSLQFNLDRDAGDPSQDQIFIEGLAADLSIVIGGFTARFASKEATSEVDGDKHYCVFFL